jgi:hypothetical protein
VILVGFARRADARSSSPRSSSTVPESASSALSTSCARPRRTALTSDLRPRCCVLSSCLVSSRLVSSRLVSSRLVSSRLVSSRLVSSRLVSSRLASSRVLVC